MSQRPLQNKSIMITRPREQAGPMVDLLKQKGAIPILCPTITINGVGPEKWDHHWIDWLQEAAWIVFTSANGVRYFLKHLNTNQRASIDNSPVQFAVVGKKTADVLNSYGFKPSFVPDTYIAQHIVAGMGDLTDQSVLIPRGNLAGDELPKMLMKAGARVYTIVVYNTIPVEPTAELYLQVSNGIDAVLFTSSSTVIQFMSNQYLRANAGFENAVVACIGPVTAATARDLGLEVHVVPEDHTGDGLVDALELYVGRQKTNSVVG